MSADFNFNSRGIPDPLLIGGANDFYSQFNELNKAQQTLEQRRQAIMQLAHQADLEKAQPVSQTPIWDEIDSLTGGMTDAEFKAVCASKEFKESGEALTQLANAMLLQMIRPHVERSPEGKKLLEQHLTNIKFLRKSASAEADKKLAYFNEYTEKYSHMTYDEYLKMKGGAEK